MLNYRVDPDGLSALVPRGTELDSPRKRRPPRLPRARGLLKREWAWPVDQ